MKCFTSHYNTQWFYLLCLKELPSKMEGFNLGGNCYTIPADVIEAYCDFYKHNSIWLITVHLYRFMLLLVRNNYFPSKMSPSYDILDRVLFAFGKLNTLVRRLETSDRGTLLQWPFPEPLLSHNAILSPALPFFFFFWKNQMHLFYTLVPFIP